MSCQHVNMRSRSLHLQSDQPPHVAESRGPPAPLAQGPGASLGWLEVGQVCVCVSAVYSANSKACRAQRPARRCTLMSRGHGRSQLRSRAIIKHDGTRREANIWHCQNGKGWWWWRGRDAPPSLLLPSFSPSLPPTAQERLCFDLQLDLSAVPLPINHAGARLAQLSASLCHSRRKPSCSPNRMLKDS